MSRIRSSLPPVAPSGATCGFKRTLKIHSFGPVLVQKIFVTDPARRGVELLNQDHASWLKSAAIRPLLPIDSPRRILAVERQTRHCLMAWSDGLMPPVEFAFETARKILP